MHGRKGGPAVPRTSGESHRFDPLARGISGTRVGMWVVGGIVGLYLLGSGLMGILLP